VFAYVHRSAGCDVGPLMTGACEGDGSGAGIWLWKVGICGAGFPRKVVGLGLRAEPPGPEPPGPDKPAPGPMPPRAKPEVDPATQATAKTAAKRRFMTHSLLGSTFPSRSSDSNHQTENDLISVAWIGPILWCSDRSVRQWPSPFASPVIAGRPCDGRASPFTAGSKAQFRENWERARVIDPSPPRLSVKCVGQPLACTRIKIQESPGRGERRPGRRTLGSQQGALSGVQKEAHGGQRTTLDVLNSQQDLMAARARLFGPGLPCPNADTNLVLKLLIFIPGLQRMPGLAVRLLVAAVACVVFIAGTIARAQKEADWPVHTALEGDQRPFLCRERDSVNLIVQIMARSFDARASDADKARRLLEIAGRLQGELCTRPVADDIIILRCSLAQRDVPGPRISTIKVSAVIRAEPSKGEQPFFAWTYLNITGSRGSTTDAQSATNRWCTEDDGTDEALSPTSEVVLALQLKLYDLGMRVPQANGLMTSETMQALIDFQKWAGLPATGQLTKRTMQKLTSTTPPSTWVALAFDGYGNFGADTGVTRRGSEASAIARLQRVSRSAYKLSSIAGSCIAIATARYVDRRRRTTFSQVFTSGGATSGAASENVLAYCGREKNGGNCDVRQALCAAGAEEQVQRFDRKNIPVNSPAPNLRFDPSNIPANSPPPQSGQ
jgi:peptidoglycan hydrolase-like protein with peptidoglycan-binding domain